MQSSVGSPDISKDIHLEFLLVKCLFKHRSGEFFRLFSNWWKNKYPSNFIVPGVCNHESSQYTFSVLTYKSMSRNWKAQKLEGRYCKTELREPLMHFAYHIFKRLAEFIYFFWIGATVVELILQICVIYSITCFMYSLVASLQSYSPGPVLQ